MKSLRLGRCVEFRSILAALERHVNSCLDDTLARNIAVEAGDRSALDDDDVGVTAVATSSTSSTGSKRARLGEVDNDDDSAAMTAVSCPLCRKLVAVRELFILDECDHKFCRTCIKDRVLTTVASDVRVSCPVAACNTVLSIRDVKELMPQRTSLVAPSGSSHVASARLMAELQHIADSNAEKSGFSCVVY